MLPTYQYNALQMELIVLKNLQCIKFQNLFFTGFFSIVIWTKNIKNYKVFPEINEEKNVNSGYSKTINNNIKILEFWHYYFQTDEKEKNSTNIEISIYCIMCKTNFHFYKLV